ncbi:hypothetical protein P8C59_005693 [Phyllachora maydis]|uniref:Dpy-30 domain-containing protein n=1 Tax=Phyllachora maydis TaxID=1825666 RepID=A0AAD9I643_9PEZI|nr:hypothetical protein P8C59_005693 [Phyllachora maydis]
MSEIPRPEVEDFSASGTPTAAQTPTPAAATTATPTEDAPAPALHTNDTTTTTTTHPAVLPMAEVGAAEAQQGGPSGDDIAMEDAPETTTAAPKITFSPTAAPAATPAPAGTLSTQPPQPPQPRTTTPAAATTNGDKPSTFTSSTFAPTPPAAAAAAVPSDPSRAPSSLPPEAPPERGQQPLPAEPAAHGAPVRQYLNSTVVPAVLEGMKRLAQDKPENPLRWLGDFLLAEAQKREARGGEEVATATATASG